MEGDEVSMRSAFYYPHTEIRNEAVIKTALLLWDEIHVISPWDQFRPHGEEQNPWAAQAFEVIGRRHVPTEAEKLEAHEIIEDFLSQTRLPPAFTFTSAIMNAPRTNTLRRSVDPYSYGRYEIYSEKLLYKTWSLLRSSSLAGEPRGSDHPTTIAMGLTLMSILADCCAKKSFTRVTDRAASYAALQSLLVDGLDPESEAIKNELVPIAVRTVNPRGLNIKRLIDFRKNEGYAERNLRHRLLRHLDEQARLIAQAETSTARKEALRQFQTDIQDDYRELKEALKLNAVETIVSREMILTLLGTVGMAAAAGLRHSLPLPEVATASGGSVAIGGLIAAKTKFAKERRKVLKEHPTAYLLEAPTRLGRFRIY
jgi:hypothetical protein